MNIPIVLVCVGTFQEYITTCIEQLHLLGNMHIHLIIDDTLIPDDFIEKFPYVSLYRTSLYNVDTFNKKIKLRGSFWQNCSKRFFYLSEYMKERVEGPEGSEKPIFHIENDIMVYTNLQNVYDSIPQKEKVWLAMDAPNRCIPSIMYFPTTKSLDTCLSKYKFNQNDMVNFANFFNENKAICETFPIFSDDTGSIYSKNFVHFNAIFDAAAMGQYVGGEVHRKKKGFVNETCVIKYDKYTFFWKKNDKGHLCPFLKLENGTEIPIMNMHVHSKRLHEFLSTNENFK